MTAAARTPAPDARDPATGRVPRADGTGPAGDPDDQDRSADATPAERIAAWFAPTPAELLALVLLLLGSVVATLLWWYGSVAAPADPTPAATAGTPVDDLPATDGSGSADAGADPVGAPPGGPPAEGSGTDPATAGTVDGGPVPSGVMVHVSGAVQRPGLVALPPGARVGDAVAAAGGLTPDADGPGVNLARVLVDGEQVHVPVEGEERPPAPAGEPGAGPTAAPGSSGIDPEGRIDLNTASASELETLPGIGPTRAAAIVTHREQHGPFQAPGDLRAVSGIGEATFQNLAPLIVVR